LSRYGRAVPATEVSERDRKRWNDDVGVVDGERGLW
jgi:hypothetical protein